MKGLWQATVGVMMLVSMAMADESGKSFTWNPPKVGTGIFSSDLGMLDSERDDYATKLAIFATNRVTSSKASPASLEFARRVLALAQHLSPRNRKAVVVAFQLGKGVLPEATQTDYSPQALSKLLITRGQLLAKQGGADNTLLARYFIDLAAEMDPKNEDAVYASEVQRIDHGALDWNMLTDFKGKEKSADPKP